MVKKRIFVILLIVFVFVIVLLNSITINFFGSPFSPVAITGNAVKAGYVRVSVESFVREITISSPGNVTYENSGYTCVTGNMPKCNNSGYLLPLNTFTNFFVEDASNWTYSLYDLRHNVPVYTDVIFIPNASVPAVRWENMLTVFAEEEDSDSVNQTVIFTITVENSAPIIEGLDAEIFVCEGEEIENLDASYFNVSDIDEDSFSGIGATDISPKNDLFDIYYLPQDRSNISRLQIVSILFGKSHIESYYQTITVIDPEPRSDYQSTNISVIEINNAPVIINDLGAQTIQTIYFNGTNSTFSHQYNVTDTEVDSGDGNLSFNITGNLGVTINSSTGVMNYTPQAGDQGGDSKTYSLTACVTDNALASVHDNFSVCSGRGHSSGILSDCDSFSLTITNVNRAPLIDDYSPAVTTFTIPGTTTNLFSATVSDLDMTNAYPDIDWYVDGVLSEENENLSSDDFSHTFGCGVSGVHNVTIITSDSIVNVSQSWNISVTNVVCSVAVTSGSGGTGGGGGGTLGGACNEQWSCYGWGLCQNSEKSFYAGSLSPEDYSSAKDFCAQNQFDDRFCGFQITKCFDLNQCNNTEIKMPKPSESRVCYFTENPNCEDGITNCHDNDCELLVDCGGPCDFCPTCSDNKKNQGENGIDCGGPCPYACEPESPYGAISVVLIALLVSLVVVVLFIAFKLINILRYRFFLSGKKKKKSNHKV